MGFAQEIKDFTAAYTAVSDIGLKKKDQKLKEKQLDHDIEYENAMLAIKQEELGMKKAKLAAGSGGTGGDGGSGGASSSSSKGTGTGTGTGTGKGALDTSGLGVNFDDNVTTTENRTQDYNQEVADAAIGQDKVKNDEDTAGDDAADEILLGGYEKGGLVEEEAVPTAGPFKMAPKAAPTTTAPAASAATTAAPAAAPAALPTEGAAEPAAEPAAAKPKVDPKATSIIVARSMEAAGKAMDSFETKYRAPKGAVGTPEDPDGVDIATGEGGMTFEEYQKIADTVDPNGSIPVELRSAVKLSEVYTFFKDQGDEAKAIKAAKGYLAAEMRVNQTLGVLASNAFEEGNIAEGCKLINDACSRFPTGHSITVAPVESGRFVYEVKDANGKVVEKEAISTDELMESVSSIADGTLYKKMLAHAVVAARPKKEEQGGGYAEALGAVQTAYQALIDAQTAYEALPDDTPIAEKRAAHEKITAASGALEDARVSAREKGAAAMSGDGNKASQEAAIYEDINKAQVLSPEGTAIPDAPQPRPGGLFSAPEEDPAAAPAAALDTAAPAAPAEGPAKSALPPAPESVLKKAAAAIARGAPREAVLKRIQEAGYSAEGL